MTELLLLAQDDVRRALTEEVAYTSQREVFTAHGKGEVVQPARLLLPGTGDDVAFCYAARAGAKAPAVSKFGAVHPGNADAGLPAIHALITVLDPTTGAPTAVMDGTHITTIRTAAASAVAADALAAANASVLAIVGSGVQARAHLSALARVRRLSEIRLTSRTLESAHVLADDWNATHPGGPTVQVVDDVPTACAGADIVALTTTATDPVLKRSDVADGAFVITVGSFAPDRSEVTPDVLHGARVVVDDVETALRDNGAVVKAIEAGALEAADVRSLGEVLCGDAPVQGEATDQTANQRPSRSTVFASVGIGAQDAAAAAAVIDEARRRGLGTTFSL